MIYTIKDEQRTLYGLDAKDINAVRKYIYWHENGAERGIWKGRTMLGRMEYVSGWKYLPETEYRRCYDVTSQGTLIGEDFDGDC